MTTDAASPITYRSPLLDLAGAVAIDPALDPVDAGIAWHYADPLREQRRLDEGTGFVDLSNRGVIAVEGPDRLSWLHSLISQHVEHLAPGVGTEGLLLSPNGHVEQHFGLLDDGSTTWLHTEPGRDDALVAFLDSMRFMLRVEVRNETANRSVIWFPRDSEPVSAMLQEQRLDSVVVPARRGTFALIPRKDVVEASSTWGEPAGVWAFEALRVAAAEPRLGFETDHRTIPHEVGWIGPAVHLQKGCYRGQETVARVHNLGRPPRRLVLLHLDGSTQAHLPAHGTEVMVEDRAVGFIGTAVHHFELGPVALAIIKRNVPTDIDLVVGEVTASQEVVVAP